MKKQTNSEEIKKIKEMLPRVGAYNMISGMINGAYAPNTIKAMLNQQRKMNPGVLDAAKCVVEILQQGKELPLNVTGYKRQVQLVIPANSESLNQ